MELIFRQPLHVDRNCDAGCQSMRRPQLDFALLPGYGITTFLRNGGTIEYVQQIANHESPRTTKLYDRTNDVISLNERACPAVPGIERTLIR